MTVRRAPQHPLPVARFVPGTGAPHPRKSGALPVVPDDDALAFGADLFHAGYYWEAHEVWEGLWVALGRDGEDARAVQALIKLAAAGVKVLQQQPEGVRRHADGARVLLSALTRWPVGFPIAVDIARLAATARMIAEAPPGARAGPVFDEELPIVA